MHESKVLFITSTLSIPLSEIDISAIRAQGAGGQNVNKVSSAVHLRFEVASSSLPPTYKRNLLTIRDNRLSKDGVIIIKSQSHRSQSNNRQDALLRLAQLIRSAGITRKKRKPTRPSRKAVRKRIDSKVKRGRVKSLRKKVSS